MKNQMWSNQSALLQVKTVARALNTDVAYTEILMPDDVRENLFTLAKQLLEGETPARTQLESIYATYPLQAGVIFLDKLKFYETTVPFDVVCQRCGLPIPRARVGNCPICNAPAVVQKKMVEEITQVQKKTAEDPMQILKLRLAKGEISKEEYEDLKKSVES